MTIIICVLPIVKSLSVCLHSQHLLVFPYVSYLLLTGICLFLFQIACFPFCSIILTPDYFIRRSHRKTEIEKFVPFKQGEQENIQKYPEKIGLESFQVQITALCIQPFTFHHYTGLSNLVTLCVFGTFFRKVEQCLYIISAR